MLKRIVKRLQEGEQLKSLNCIIILVFLASISIGQPAKPITRWSSLDFKLDNKELRLLDDYPSIDPLSGKPVESLIFFARKERQTLPPTSNNQVAFVIIVDTFDAL